MSESWYSEGGKLSGPRRRPAARPPTPRAALATAEFRGSGHVAFRLTEPPGDVRGWCVEIRRGCEVCGSAPIEAVEGCEVIAAVCACCLPRDVYRVVLVDEKCVDCASAYLDLMKSEGYGRARETCTCGGYHG